MFDFGMPNKSDDEPKKKTKYTTLSLTEIVPEFTLMMFCLLLIYLSAS